MDDGSFGDEMLSGAKWKVIYLPPLTPKFQTPWISIWVWRKTDQKSSPYSPLNMRK